MLRQDRNIYIGAYNVTYNKRSKFVYRTYTYCTGYTIRRQNWKSNVFNQEHEEIEAAFEKIITKEYEETTMNKVIEEKKRFMKKWNERCDYSGMLRVIYENDHSHDEGGHGEDNSGAEVGSIGDGEGLGVPQNLEEAS